MGGLSDRRTHSQSPYGIFQSVFDRVQRLTKLTEPANSKVATYTYHPDGLRSTRIAYGTGQKVLSDWDAARRQTRVTNARGKTATLTYDDAGKVIRRDYANGGYSALAYDAAGNRTLMQRVEGLATATTWGVLTIGVGGLHCPDL